MGLLALRHVGSSWTRDPVHVPCTVRWLLTHSTIRKVCWWGLEPRRSEQISEEGKSEIASPMGLCFFSFIYKCEKALFSTKKNSQPRWQGTADNGSDTRGMAFEQSVVWVIMWRMPPPRSMVVLIIDAFLKSRICSLFFGESTIPRNYSSLSRRVPQTQMLGREYLKARRLGTYSWPSEEQSNPVCSSSPLIKNQSRPILSLNYIFLENLDPRDWSSQWILFSK